MDDIVAKLERLALLAEVSNHHIQDMRVMPAAGVADILYEAMDTIVDLRVALHVATEDATEAEAFAEELMDGKKP
jgi:hypothetical protein